MIAVHGCVVNESHAFLTQNLATCLIYNYEQGFVERTIGKLDSDNDFTYGVLLHPM